MNGLTLDQIRVFPSCLKSPIFALLLLTSVVDYGLAQNASSDTARQPDGKSAVGTPASQLSPQTTITAKEFKVANNSYLKVLCGRRHEKKT
jgi:hypothetical protein